MKEQHLPSWYDLLSWSRSSLWQQSICSLQGWSRKTETQSGNRKPSPQCNETMQEGSKETNLGIQEATFFVKSSQLSTAGPDMLAQFNQEAVVSCLQDRPDSWVVLLLRTKTFCNSSHFPVTISVCWNMPQTLWLHQNRNPSEKSCYDHLPLQTNNPQIKT